ncbi:hypothetical protein O6H91_16G094500 [Diphasiastrum complanatum]|uniref:Uncharacterized protein n=1 Tax=Diphasiastrum complanatum TaxID=34168 RepID=A0ACC2BEP6_DIPCM|nr:hypothetical protein O6H91_16G094500 [Diphasiastrum complanatum]
MACKEKGICKELPYSGDFELLQKVESRGSDYSWKVLKLYWCQKVKSAGSDLNGESCSIIGLVSCDPMRCSYIALLGQNQTCSCEKGLHYSGIFELLQNAGSDLMASLAALLTQCPVILCICEHKIWDCLARAKQ